MKLCYGSHLERDSQIFFILYSLLGSLLSCNDKMCIDLAEQTEGPRSKLELHLKVVRPFTIFMAKSLLIWVLCNLHCHFNLARCHRRKDRRGQGDPEVSLTLCWLLRHCHLEHICPHTVVCSICAHRLDCLTSWHVPSRRPGISPQSVAAAVNENAATRVQTKTDTQTPSTRCSQPPCENRWALISLTDNLEMLDFD